MQVVSDKFDGMRLVQRHQLVYALLDAQFAVRPPLGSCRDRQKLSAAPFLEDAIRFNTPEPLTLNPPPSLAGPASIMAPLRNGVVTDCGRRGGGGGSQRQQNAPLGSCRPLP